MPPQRRLALSALRLSVVLLLLGTALPSLAHDADDDAGSLARAITGGDVSLSLRYRYERVGENWFDDDAHASTLRTLFGYRTLTYKGVSVLVQAQYVAAVFRDSTFNNGGAAELATASPIGP